MKLPLVQRFFDANADKPPWAVRVGLAGMLFVCVGVALLACAFVVPAFQKYALLNAGVTLIVSGIVLCVLGCSAEPTKGDGTEAR